MIDMAEKNIGSINMLNDTALVDKMLPTAVENKVSAAANTTSAMAY
jgi:hypothetical protein